MRKRLAQSFVVTMALVPATACNRAESPGGAGGGEGASATASATSSAVADIGVDSGFRRPLNPPMPVPTQTTPPPERVTRKRHRSGPSAMRPTGSWPTAGGDVTSQQPNDPNGNTIYVASDDRCYFEEPMKPPYPPMPTGGRAVRAVFVDCPAELDDPAWDSCDGNLSLMTAPKGKGGSEATCLCMPLGGNPPPPPTKNACPKKPKQ